MYLQYAVLDLHFSPSREGVFAIATSKGEVCLYTINPSGIGPIDHIRTYQIFSSSSLTLSLAWNHFPLYFDTIAASSSDGRIAIFDTKEQLPVNCTETETHSLEAWTLAWASEGEVIYSGGDDSALCRHGISVRPISRSPDDGDKVSLQYNLKTPLRDAKTHMAGVTAILPLQPVFEGKQIFLTGSYDEHIRLLLPVDGSSRPKLLAEQKLGGGVWRLSVLQYVMPDNSAGK